jgi:hypothetical protein
MAEEAHHEVDHVEEKNPSGSGDHANGEFPLAGRVLPAPVTTPAQPRQPGFV